MFFWENGLNLKERLVPQGLSNAASAAVEALKINSIMEKLRKGRPAVLKRRNVHGEQMANLANFYFRTWNIPIRFLSKVKVWRRWEIKCFTMPMKHVACWGKTKAFWGAWRCFDRKPSYLL